MWQEGKILLANQAVELPVRVGARMRGFSLIELMATIAIGAILISMAIGAWNSTQKNSRAEAAAEEIYSAMTAARIRALTTGKRQYVEVDFSNDRVASTVWGGVYDAAAGAWTASTSWKSYPGVDLVSSNSSGVVNASRASRLFSFSNRGTGVSASLVCQWPGGSAQKHLIVVNGVTSRVKKRTLP